MEVGMRHGGQNYSPWVSVFNMCNAAIGSGVLSFPFAFRQTGVIGGLFFTGMIWLVEVGALCLLIRTADKYKTKSYQELVVATFGPRMAIVTSITILVFLVGSLISYFIITGDVFQPIFANWFGPESLLAQRRVLIVFFAMVVVLPLSLKRNMRDLRWSSTLSVLMLTYLSVALGTLGIAHLMDEGIPEHIEYFRGGYNAFIAMDVVVFAFHCHIQVMPIFAELADNPKPFFDEARWSLREPLLDAAPLADGVLPSKQKSSRVNRMDGVVAISMTLCFVGYCLVGEFGYLLYPDVESDILISFGNSNHFMNFARVGMAAEIINESVGGVGSKSLPIMTHVLVQFSVRDIVKVSMVCFPVCHYPCRTILEDAARHILRGRIGEGFSWTLHIILTLLLCGFALGTSLLTSNLGTVFSIVGSTGGVLVIFIIPGFILLRNKLGEGDSSCPLDAEALQSQEEIVFMKILGKILKLGGGSVLIFFGCLIFCVTAYVTTVGLDNL